MICKKFRIKNNNQLKKNIKELIFKKKSNLKKLENLIHPLVRKKMRKLVSEASNMVSELKALCKKEDVWRKADDSIRSFPQNAPPVSYRCCADKNWKYMDQEGGGKASKFEVLGRLNKTLSSDMYVESQRGYAAAITYVDEQLGKLLDVLDELQVRQI